jgi:hypothetical protein
MPTMPETEIYVVPAAPPVAVRGRRVARLVRRRRRWRLVATIAVLTALAAVAAVLVTTRGGHRVETPPPAAFGVAPPSVAWALSWGDPEVGSSLAIVGVPPGEPAVAIVAADDARVDLPNGAPLTVGGAVRTGQEAIQTAQALMNRRVGHYLVSTPQDIGELVDRLGTITFGAQGSAIVNGAAVGPGFTTTTGAQAAGYLTDGTGVDPWVRWEDVLSGIVGAAPKASAWTRVPGRSDDGTVVAGLLASAHGATVVDLPTANEFGILKVDADGMSAMLASSFTTSVGGLVRVVVQNGNGMPGLGERIGVLLAPYGYRVVDSQNAGTFDEPLTKIVAASNAFVGWAREAQQLMRAGKVYLDQQQSGIADITIIVGKDFGTG